MPRRVHSNSPSFCQQRIQCEGWTYPSFCQNPVWGMDVLLGTSSSHSNAAPAVLPPSLSTRRAHPHHVSSEVTKRLAQDGDEKRQANGAMTADASAPLLEMSGPNQPTGSNHTCTHLCGICAVVAFVLLVRSHHTHADPDTAGGDTQVNKGNKRIASCSTYRIRTEILQRDLPNIASGGWHCISSALGRGEVLSGIVHRPQHAFCVPSSLHALLCMDVSPGLCLGSTGWCCRRCTPANLFCLRSTVVQSLNAARACLDGAWAGVRDAGGDGAAGVGRQPQDAGDVPAPHPVRQLLHVPHLLQHHRPRRGAVRWHPQALRQAVVRWMLAC
jgi:hypothetical protein